MKTLIYQLMKQPQLINQIENGAYDFPEKINKEEKRAIIRAVKSEDSVTEGYKYWIHG